MNKKIASIIGGVLGAVIIIIGFCVMGISVEPYSITIGSDIKFGADFYTEMYDVTRDVGRAINSTRFTLVNAVEGVCDAIGWLIVAIGLVDLAYFGLKVAPSGEDNSGNTYAAAPATSAPAGSAASAPAQNSERPAAAGEWKCTCGRIHKQYVSSCSCGASKREAIAAQNNKKD